MKEQISNCCQAQASVSSSDEGTSCYICTQCKKPCDLYVKEQVSVDDLSVENFIKKIMSLDGGEEYDALVNAYCKAKVFQLVDKAEYDRLKSFYDRCKRIDY